MKIVAALVLAVLASSACGTATPTAPTTAVPPVIAASPRPGAPTNIEFPPLAGPFRRFRFAQDLSRGVADYTRRSEFLLYDNGAFVLTYTGDPYGYRGAYSESNGVITFHWEGWSTAGPWGASGRISGDALTVSFNLIMQMTDFEDAVYVLVR